MKRSGFTLAEVLITLAVIGVVAAIAIPSMITNHQNSVNATKLEKFYLTFQEAIRLYELDQGSPNDAKSSGLFDSGNSNGTQEDNTFRKLLPYLNVTTYCGVSDTGTVCTADKDGQVATYDNLYTAATTSYDYSWNAKAILADGSAVYLNDQNDNCTTTSADYNGYSCAEIAVDVNGPKKGPNKLGRDLFKFRAFSDVGLRAEGDINYNVHWDTSSNHVAACGKDIRVDGRGNFCASRVQAEGWKINY